MAELTISIHWELVALGALGLLVISIIVAVILNRRKVKFFCSLQGKLLERAKKLEARLAQIESKASVSPLEDKIWHEEETNFIFQLHEDISFTLDREIIAKNIAEAVHKFFNARSTVLFLLDTSTQTLKIAYAVGIDPTLSENIVLQKSESISGFVLAKNNPLKVEDVQKDHYLKKINRESYLNKNFISVPIIFQDSVLGVLNVCDRKDDKLLTNSDLSLLLNVGRVGGVAFQNIVFYEQINDNYLKTIAALATAIDARDPYTKYHSENVTRYTLAMAKELRLSYHEREVLRRAALLHDVGKIGIRDNILLKIDKLSDEEYRQMQIHPARGEEIIKPLSFLKEAANLIRHHHERFDGNGYPDKLRGHEIELGARILAVADTFDAMTTDWPYRRALSRDEAIAELVRSKNVQLDPMVVDCFVKILQRDPHIMRPPSLEYNHIPTP